MKKCISLFLCIAMSFSLTACAAGGDSAVSSHSSAASAQSAGSNSDAYDSGNGKISYSHSESSAADSDTDASGNGSSGKGKSISDIDSDNLETEDFENEQPLTGVNIIPNGDFSSESSKWGIYKESGGSASIGASGGRLKVKITKPGYKDHSVQVYCDGFEILEGGSYTFSFDISSTKARTMEWRIQVNGGDYHPYARQTGVEIGTEPVHVEYDFTMEEASDPSPRLCFNLGNKNAGLDGEELGAHEIYIDNVSLILNDARNAKNVDLSTGEINVNLNQLGFTPDAYKSAVIRNASLDSSFSLVDVNSGRTVYEGELTDSPGKGSSDEKVALAVFTDFKETGTYKVVTEGNGESFPFVISDNPYGDALKAACKMLYLQRCGMELTGEYAGDFAHKACHTEYASVYGTDKTIEVSGGWHDAGDYGRYVVAGVTTLADLLLAYENYPDKFTDDYDIPESGNGIPDILDEARYELEWLFKMQDEDGGVYHKVTGLNFDGICMPEDCTEKLYVLTKSKTATGDFAAIMYMAGRVYRDIYPEFSARCIAAADKALPYLEEHISERNYVNPSDVLTGEYPDNSSKDEYLWALAEGYKTCGYSDYADKIVDFDLNVFDDNNGLGWAVMTEYAYYAYLTCSSPSPKTAAAMKAALQSCTVKLAYDSSVDAYGSSIIDDYPWGSNMAICNNAIMMLMADELLPGDDTDYIAAVGRQLDYIMGRNTTSYCFLTGFGTLSPEHPHHRPSQYLDECMPGMLVGGPDSDLEDPYAKSVLKDLPKAHRYADNAQSYSCNEITIYWNGSLIYLLAACSASAD